MNTGADKRATLFFHYRGRVFVAEQQYSRERSALSDFRYRVKTKTEIRRANRGGIGARRSMRVLIRSGQASPRCQTAGSYLHLFGRSDPRTTVHSYRVGFTRFRSSYRAVGGARNNASESLIAIDCAAAGFSGDVSFSSSGGVSGFDCFALLVRVAGTVHTFQENIDE
jgi:hypothetical protein